MSDAHWTGYRQGYQQAVWEIKAVAELRGWQLLSENASELAQALVELTEAEVEA
jgi:hypothetical protein